MADTSATHAKTPEEEVVCRGRAVRVDLSGSRLGPAWRSTVVRGCWPADWTDDRLRAEAAAHYDVAVDQVTLVAYDFQEDDDA